MGLTNFTLKAVYVVYFHTIIEKPSPTFSPAAANFGLHVTLLSLLTSFGWLVEVDVYCLPQNRILGSVVDVSAHTSWFLRLQLLAGILWVCAYVHAHTFSLFPWMYCMFFTTYKLHWQKNRKYIPLSSLKRIDFPRMIHHLICSRDLSQCFLPQRPNKFVTKLPSRPQTRIKYIEMLVYVQVDFEILLLCSDSTGYKWINNIVLSFNRGKTHSCTKFEVIIVIFYFFQKILIIIGGKVSPQMVVLNFLTIKRIWTCKIEVGIWTIKLLLWFTLFTLAEGLQ